ncbi:MAG: PorP/SprF family type IX secretion system membrane protein, partial [Bacteroidota bacterium]
MQDIYRLVILGILLLLANKSLQAQDPILSQYYTNKIYLNPALTGFEGGTTVNMNYRNQWYAIAGNLAQFTTNSAAVDVELPCIQSAFGLIYVDNLEGEGRLRWQSLGLSYAWRSRPQQSQIANDWELSFGLKGSFDWRSLDWSQLVFSDQLDAIQGIIGPSAVPSPTGGMSVARAFDLDFGGAFVYQFGEDRLRTGVTLNHLVRIDPSPLLLEDTLPVRTTIDLAYVKNIRWGNASYHLVPMLKFDMQRSSARWRDSTALFGGLLSNPFDGFWYRSVQYGVAFSFQKAPGLWGGVWMNSRFGPQNRFNTNSFIVALGMEFANDPDFRHADRTY